MAAVARWLRLTGCKGIKKILRMQVSPPFFLSHPRDYPAEPPSAGDASGGQNKWLHIRRGVVRPPSLPPRPPWLWAKAGSRLCLASVSNSRAPPWLWACCDERERLLTDCNFSAPSAYGFLALSSIWRLVPNGAAGDTAWAPHPVLMARS